MNAHLKEAFTRIKPVCDMVMVNPSPQHISSFIGLVCDLKKEILQELQQYMVFPFITHLQSKEIETKFELQRLLVDGIREVLERVKVCSFEMCMKIEMGLLSLVFEKPKPGMIADVPEELKLSVVQCLTVLMLNIDQPTRIRMVTKQVPLLAQAVFVSVHLAKLEKHRGLRLEALNCLSAHTASHPKLTDEHYQITDPVLESAVVNMMSCILPGVLAALQDVATCPHNPGHAIVLNPLRTNIASSISSSVVQALDLYLLLGGGAINVTHRVLCLTMHNKHLNKKDIVTADDFVNLLEERLKADKDVSKKDTLKDERLSHIIATRDYHSLAEFIRSGKEESDVTTKRDRDRGKAKTKNKRHNTPNTLKEVSPTNVVEDRPSSTSSKTADTPPKDIPKRTPEWYAMAGEKLAVVVKSLVPLVTHDHCRVRKELAIMCYRIISECGDTMKPSLSMTLDVLITLSNDNYKEVSDYCRRSIKYYFLSATHEKQAVAVESLCENFFTTINCLPRILNNIDSNRKYSALNLLRGYIVILSDTGRPQRLTTTLSPSDAFPRLCDAMQSAALLHTDLQLLTRHAARDVTATPSKDTPWRRLRHLDTYICQQIFHQILQKLGEAECAELLLDRFLELFQERRSCELVYIMNFMGSAPNSSPNLAKRIISAYIEEDVWYQPLEVGTDEPPLTKEDTYDETVYNPRAWIKDSVPGLYEGAIETRYTDISYSQPRVKYVDPNTCSTLAEAQHNMAFCCLLTEGLGFMAKRLQYQYQPFLLKTLCLILERVGSKYENLHLAGIRAINEVAFAFGHSNVTELIAENADYFTSQITSRLKKAWNMHSALQILSVVMEYSDSSILDYLYGIVEDVLVQSCDKYYQTDLYSYLQVYLTFVNCIRDWFPVQPKPQHKQNEIDILKDLIDFENNKEKVEKLLSEEDFERECGKSVEEMYKEDLKRREEDMLEYDDTVAPEAPAVPQHIKVTVTILKRCVHFIPSKRDEAILALQVLALGLPVIKHYEDELLPLVHVIWSPLVGRFESEPPVLRKAFELFVTLASVSKDFIRSRAVKEVLPYIYKFLKKSASESYLKDTGSAYRLSHAYHLQVAVLTALPGLVVDLMLHEERLVEAMRSVEMYLSNKQPKPLQMLAVKFYKDVLNYNYGAAWQHLRTLCANDAILSPPQTKYIVLEPVKGTPYETANANYDTNIKLIFYVHK